MRKKAFTLIELIAVLVILAILALIVTPLVMNIIRKARISADKRSIDAYGRSVELAIANYLLDNGVFPTSIDQLTIEYSGDRVVCSTTQLNSDSTVYLSGCTVGVRGVEGYTYGEDLSPTYTLYLVGDYISYNGVNYYVIEDSGVKNDTVKLLKENPLFYSEMNSLNFENLIIFTQKSHGMVYGKIEYGATSDYSASSVKQVVEAWAATAVNKKDIVKARLMKKNEIENNIGFVEFDCCGGCGSCISEKLSYDWINNNDTNTGYRVWTMSDYDSLNVWIINDNGKFESYPITQYGLVRPVLELNKSADITKLN